MDKKLIDLQETLDTICGGNFTKNDVLAFMIRLRQFKPIDPILVDLCDFFAHSEGRDKGESHRFIESFLEKFIDANEKNAGIVIPTPFFNKKEVVNKILIHISNNKLIVDKLSFAKYTDKFISLLLDSLDNVEYVIKNPKVNRCLIQRKGAEAFFCFNLKNISRNAEVKRCGPGLTCISIFYDGDKMLQPFEIILR